MAIKFVYREIDKDLPKQETACFLYTTPHSRYKHRDFCKRFSEIWKDESSTRGSRYADGNVPNVNWNSGNRKLNVNWNNVDNRDDNLRSRVEVSRIILASPASFAY